MSSAKRWGVAVFVFALFIGAPVYGSQIANHVRIAYEAMDDPETPAIIKDVLARNLEAYKAGAAGPDVLTNLVGQYSGLAHKAHYEKTGELVKNMLQIAAQQNDPAIREKYFAYTIGWLTHNYLDVYEHAVVNQYGGYYAVSHDRHKDLEMFESSHVLATLEKPSQDLVSRRSGLQEYLIMWAFQKTYSPTMKIPFGAGDLHHAANVIEKFTENADEEFKSQKLQSRLTSAFELAVGRVTFIPKYYHIVDPVFAGIKSITPPDQENKIVRVEVDYLLMDNSLKVSYITDWYDSNSKALTAISGRLRAIASYLSLRNGTLVIDPNIDPAVPDYNLDTGRLESVGDSQAVSISSKFKPVEEMELKWEIFDGQQKIADGTEPIFITQPGKVGTFTLSIPASRQFYSDIGKKQLKLSVVLSAKNSNTHLMQGPYATAFRFHVDEQNNRVSLKNRERLPIQNSDQKDFWISSAALAKGESEKETIVDPNLMSSLDDLRSLAARAAAMLAESRELLSSLTQQKSDLDRAAKDLQAGRAAYEKLLNQLNENSRLISQESQRLPGLAAQSEAASQRAIEAKQNVEKSALEACEKALLIKNSKSQAERDRLLPDVIAAAGRASSQARISKEQSEESKKAMQEIQQILQRSGELNSTRAGIEWNQLQEIAQRIRQISGDAPTPVRRIEGIAAELTRIAAQAAAVRHQILETLKPLSSDQAAGMKKEMDQLYGSISAAEKETANIAAEARSLLASMQQTAGIASTIETIQPPSSAAPAADKDSLARADSAAAVAETFSAQAADDAAKAQACANASRNRVPGEPPGSTDWDQAADSAKSSTDTATNWDAAAAESKSATSSETPLPDTPLPEPDHTELDDPDTDYNEPDYTEPDYPETDDEEEEKNRNMEDLAQGLIDLLNTINKGNQGIQNQPNTQNRPQRQQETKQEGPGCVIYADTRQFPNTPFQVRRGGKAGMTLISVIPEPSKDPKAQTFLDQQYGRIISTHNNSKAALDAARRICPNPVSESIR